MIVIKVELWSAVTGQKTELARMMIANVGGLPGGKLRDYLFKVYRGRSQEALHKAMLSGDDKYVTKTGRVDNHPSEREHVWNLVAKGLKAMGYGGSN